MADSFEEEHAGRSRSLDEHENASRDDGEEADDIHHTDCVENDVTWTSQRFGRELHHDDEVVGFGLERLEFRNCGVVMISFDGDIQKPDRVSPVSACTVWGW